MARVKAVALRFPQGGEPELLAYGKTGDCMKAAKAAGAKIVNLGDEVVQVYSTEGLIYNEDGRKADYARRQAEKEAADKAADSGLADEAATPKPKPAPTAKKVAKKVAKKRAGNQTPDANG